MISFCIQHGVVEISVMPRRVIYTPPRLPAHVLGRIPCLRGWQAEVLKERYFDWLLEQGQEEKAGELREREQRYVDAIGLYLQGGLPAKAARVVAVYNVHVCPAATSQVGGLTTPKKSIGGPCEGSETPFPKLQRSVWFVLWALARCFF